VLDIDQKPPFPVDALSDFGIKWTAYLFLALGTQHSKRSCEQCECTHGQAGINFGGVLEHKGISERACAKHKTQQDQCGFQKIFRHVQILSRADQKN